MRSRHPNNSDWIASLYLSVAVLLGGMLWYSPAVGQTSASAKPKKTLVSVGEVVLREVHEGQTFVGTVMPLKKSLVGSAVDGRVVEFPVNEGDAVKKGQVLAQLRTRQLELELAAAQDELEAVKQELAEMEAGPLVEEIQQSQARLAAAAALKDFASSRFERLQMLYARKSASEDEVQEAASQNHIGLQKYLEAQAALKLLKQGVRQEKKAQTRARIASLEHQAERLQDQIDRHTIVAPFDGYVVAEHTEVGQWVMQGAPIVEVVALGEVDVQVMVMENYAASVTLGQTARVEVTSLNAQRRKTPLVGQVSLIVPQAEVRSRSFPVKIRVTNPMQDGRPLLQAGMFAKVTLPLGQSRQATMVPKDALVLGGSRPQVIVVKGMSDQPNVLVVESVPVELGVADGGFVQVLGDLQPGQQIVMHGNERLRTGQMVQILPEFNSRPTVPSVSNLGAED